MVTSQNLAVVGHHTSLPTANFVSQPSGFAAMAPSQWLADSGCNTHITSDLSNMSTTSKYNEEDHVSVGNGQNLPISHTSHGLLHTPSTFSLSHLFHVPNIATNLLSINQLFLDNNYTVLFDYDYFLVQDKYAGKILYCGHNVNGLYPFHSSVEPSSTSSASFASVCLAAHKSPYTFVILSLWFKIYSRPVLKFFEVMRG